MEVLDFRSDTVTRPTPAMREAMTGSDVVIHLAAWRDAPDSRAEQATAVNVEGTRVSASRSGKTRHSGSPLTITPWSINVLTNSST